MKYRNRTMAALVAVSALSLAACSSGSSDETTAPTGTAGAADYSGQTLKVMHYEGAESAMGESGGLPVAANTADVQNPDAQALIGLFNEVNDRDGLSFYPDWPTPSFYGDLNGVMQGLVNGTFSPEQAQTELEDYYESYVSTVR